MSELVFADLSVEEALESFLKENTNIQFESEIINVTGMNMSADRQKARVSVRQFPKKERRTDTK